MGFTECPNYIETLWHEKDNPQPRIVKDCAPKRTLLMLQELYNRTFSLQQQVSQGEGQIIELKATLSNLCRLVKYVQDNPILPEEKYERIE